MFRQIGVTEMGTTVVGGVFSFYETNGLPLDIILEVLRSKNVVPCWWSFYLEATRAGMKHERIIAKLREAITDVYGFSFAEHVCGLLSKKDKSEKCG